MKDLQERLRQHGIQPTPQRMAVAEFVLGTDTHPSADEVYAQVVPRCPTLSRATVYNTLNLLVERGLLKTCRLQEEAVGFDARIQPHHHFVDEETGQVHDIPWDALRLQGHQELGGFDITEYQVILRGRRRP